MCTSGSAGSGVAGVWIAPGPDHDGRRGVSAAVLTLVGDGERHRARAECDLRASGLDRRLSRSKSSCSWISRKWFRIAREDVREDLDVERELRQADEPHAHRFAVD